MEKFENFESIPDRAKAILAKKIFFFDNEEIIKKYRAKIAFDLFDRSISVNYNSNYKGLGRYDNFIGSMEIKFSMISIFLNILLNGVISWILLIYIIFSISDILFSHEYTYTITNIKIIATAIALLIFILCINIRKYKKKLYDILLDLCIDQSKTNHLFNFGFVILSTREEYLLSGNIRIDFYFMEDTETKLYNILSKKENRNDK